MPSHYCPTRFALSHSHRSNIFHQSPYFLPESVRKIARSVSMVRRLTLFVLMVTPPNFDVLRTNFGDFSTPAFDEWGRGNGLGLKHAY